MVTLLLWCEDVATVSRIVLSITRQYISRAIICLFDCLLAKPALVIPINIFTVIFEGYGMFRDVIGKISTLSIFYCTADYHAVALGKYAVISAKSNIFSILYLSQ